MLSSSMPVALFFNSLLNLRFSATPSFKYFIARLLPTALLAAMSSSAVFAQSNPPNQPSSIRCPSPANPHRAYRECAGRPFEFVEETLTQDWAGFRSDLNRVGITPTASYTVQLMGNPSGGRSRGFTYAGTLQAAIYWDLEKLIHVPGLSFNIGGAWSSGKNLSAEYIGNVFAAQSAYTAPNNGTNNLTLGEMYLQQQLLGNSLVLAAGRLAPQSTFATMPLLNQYMNGGINPIPGHLVINDPSFAAYPPGVEWGAQGIYNLTPKFQLLAGIFNTNLHSAGGAKGGLDFSFQEGNRGALSIVQANYLLNHADSDTGLPGQYTLGGFYASNRFNSLKHPSSTESGTYAVYALFQQMVHRDGGTESRRGLTIWAETAIAPKSNVNIMPYFLGTGLSYYGLITSRANDIVSGGFIYGTFSRYIPSTTAEAVVEANYQITLKRWLSITPDIQYIIRPSGTRAIRNAFVLGTQAAISF